MIRYAKVEDDYILLRNDYKNDENIYALPSGRRTDDRALKNNVFGLS